MKKISIILILLIGFSISCTKNFEDYNTDKKHPTAVPGGFLFANAQKALADQTAKPNVNYNILTLIAQYWTEATYTDEANYDLVNRSISQTVFRTYYRDVLNDLKDSKRIIMEDVAASRADAASANVRLGSGPTFCQVRPASRLTCKLLYIA